MRATLLAWARSTVVASTLLLLGVAALLTTPLLRDSSGTSWSELLAPYSTGAPLLEAFRIEDVRRGTVRDIVIRVVGPGGEMAAEVHVVPRGLWPGVRESRSFGIAYETHRSPSPQRDEITEQLAETLRARDTGLPSPDVIPLSSGTDPTITPWWLDALRGWQGVLLGVSVLLLGLILLTPSPRLRLGSAVIGIGLLLICGWGVPQGQVDPFGHWAVPVSILLMLLGARGSIDFGRIDRLDAVVIALIAVSLRVFLGAWGPMHVNGYGPRFIAGAVSDPDAIASYGPGYVELFSWAGIAAPINPDWAIFGVNAVVSGLVPILVFILARCAEVERRSAFVAAALLAIDPVAIRFAATESYFPSIRFLCAMAGIALVVAGRASWRGAGWRASSCAAAAGLLLAQAARIHPAAWLPVATVPFLLFAGCGSNTRRGWATVLGGTLVLGGVVLATTGDTLLLVIDNVRAGTLMRRPAPLSVWPLGAAVAVAVVCTLGRSSRRLAPAAFVSVAFWLMTRHLYGQSWIWKQSYDRLFLAVPLVAVVAAVVTPIARRGWLIAALSMTIGLAWMQVALPIISFRTTDHLEYRWLRTQLLQVPKECRVVHLAAADDRGVEIPTYVRPPSARSIALDPRRPDGYGEAFSPTPCLYYVHTSLCSSAEGSAKCAALERKLEVDVIAREVFPARPSSSLIPYDSSEVETWIGRARLRGSESAPSE